MLRIERGRCALILYPCYCSTDHRTANCQEGRRDARVLCVHLLYNIVVYADIVHRPLTSFTYPVRPAYERTLHANLMRALPMSSTWRLHDYRTIHESRAATCQPYKAARPLHRLMLPSAFGRCSCPLTLLSRLSLSLPSNVLSELVTAAYSLSCFSARPNTFEATSQPRTRRGRLEMEEDGPTASTSSSRPLKKELRCSSCRRTFNKVRQPPSCCVDSGLT